MFKWLRNLVGRESSAERFPHVKAEEYMPPKNAEGAAWLKQRIEHLDQQRFQISLELRRRRYQLRRLK